MGETLDPEEREYFAEVEMAGAPLNAAYATAQKRKADVESEESKLKRVRAESPDLADQITEEKLTLGFDIRRVPKKQRARGL